MSTGRDAIEDGMNIGIGIISLHNLQLRKLGYRV